MHIFYIEVCVICKQLNAGWQDACSKYELWIWFSSELNIHLYFHNEIFLSEKHDFMEVNWAVSWLNNTYLNM